MLGRPSRRSNGFTCANVGWYSLRVVEPPVGMADDEKGVAFAATPFSVTCDGGGGDVP